MITIRAPPDRRPLRENFNANRTLSNTSEQGILVLERGTGSGNLVEDVEIDSCEITTILPPCPEPAFEMKKRNLVLRDRGSTGNLRT